MDTFSDDSNVNLDDNRDVKTEYDVSAGESDSQEEHDVLGDMNDTDPEEVDVRYEHYKRIIELTPNDIRGLEFGSEEAGYEFYKMYARCHGFVVRKDNIGTDYKGNVNKRQFVCNRAGMRNIKHFLRLDRIREHRPITRTKCQAKFRIRLDYKTSRWLVSSFQECHNHALTPAKYMHLIPAYRGMTIADKAQVDSLHMFGVRTCHIMGYILAQKGGYSGVGFSRKDLYNYLVGQKRLETKDGDAYTALIYLQGKADNDPMFFSEYTTNADGSLKHIFWADGACRADFQCFGDVLAFDTTYKKNKYNYPLVIFSGCNHHSQTTLFGCALVSDETIDTYKWVLEIFLRAMCNKHPKSVVTDGDGAMREAIKLVFPDATHRLCAWHLHNNACENVKNSLFLEDFKKVMYCNFTPYQFEEFWKKMVVKHGLAGNKWVSKTYENKALWATAYLRDTFFGRIRTTSQCEAINSVIKTYVRKKSTIVEFMQKFEQVLREYRNNELNSDYNTFFLEPVMTTPLLKIEREASKIYTLEIFKEVKLQIEKACSLNVYERRVNGENVMFKLKMYCNTDREKHVDYDSASVTFLCDCRLFESRGIPCSHIICAMKNENVDYIPTSLICKRWTKTAKSDLISSIGCEELDSEVMKVARFGGIAATSNRLCEIARDHREFFNDIRDDMLKLVNKYESSLAGRSTQKSVVKGIGDPTIVKTKGAPRKKKDGKKRRRCTNCNKIGHYKSTCPRLLGKDDELSVSDSPVSSREVDTDKEGTAHDENMSQHTVLINQSTFQTDKDKEGTPHDESMFQHTMLSNQSTFQTDKNVKVKSSRGSKSKGKKVISSAENCIEQSSSASRGGKTEVGQGSQPIHSYNGVRPDLPHYNQTFPSSSRVRPEIVQGLYGYPRYGHGTVGQEPSFFPPYAGVPFYHQNLQFPLDPQFPQYVNGGHNPQFAVDPQLPQYYYGMPVGNNGTSCFGLLHEVMKKGGQSSGKDVLPRWCLPNTRH